MSNRIKIKLLVLALILIVPREYSPFILLAVIGVNLVGNIRDYVRRKKGALINRLVLKKELPKDSEYEVLKGAEILSTFLKLLVNILSLVYLLFLTYALSFDQNKTIIMYTMISTLMAPFIKISYDHHRQSLSGRLEFAKEGTVTKKIEENNEYFLDKERTKPLNLKMVEILVGKDSLTVGCDDGTYERVEVGDEIILVVDI